MLLNRFAVFAAGEVRLHFDLPPHCAAELFLLAGIPCYDQTPLDNAYECTVEQKDLKYVRALCENRGFSFTVLKESGLTVFVKKALSRPGLLMGIIAALFLIYESSHYVWDVKVYGCETIPREEIVELLRDNGFYIGCRHTSLNLHILCNDLPVIDDRIAWISINMQGAVAEIQVVEQKNKPITWEEKGLPVNLVAAREGQIVRFELTSGRPVVSVGQTVGIGQLLVAGYSEKESGLFPRASSGKIFAKTVFEEYLFIPYEQTVVTKGEPIVIKKCANILGKNIFFYKKGLQSGEKYDIVSDEYRPTVLSTALPFPITVTYALPLTESTVTLNKDEAKEQARTELMKTIREQTSELLSFECTFEERENGVLARAQAEGITDIAVRVEVKESE